MLDSSCQIAYAIHHRHSLVLAHAHTAYLRGCAVPATYLHLLCECINL